MKGAMRRATTFAIVALLLYAVALPVHAATILVTNTNDNGPGSLRQALAVAHDGDRITFAVSGTIPLTSGGLGVFKNVTISGPGADQLSIDGNQSPIQPVFSVSAIATISGLTIRNGADGIDNFGGRLTVRNCVISGNSRYGIYNYTQELGVVTATILSTTVSGNSQGGVFTQPFIGGATVTITDCTISGNSAGGGIFGVATLLTVTNSTISGNSTGGSGGGILVGGLFAGSSIVNSTISGNSAGTSGGGIFTFAESLRVANCTITGNSAPSGGGIYNDGQSSEICNTILNAGALGENIFNNVGTVISRGYNLSSDDGGGYLTGPGDQTDTDPLLGPLQNNGGPTFTHALLPGSPAIDAGDPNFSPPPFNDQRGPCYHRVFNGRIDIGSVETQPEPRCPTPRPRPTPPPRP
jgi:hypothetical protein